MQRLISRLLILAVFFPAVALAAPGDNFRPCLTFAASVTNSSSSTAVVACGAPTVQLDCFNAGSVTAFVAGTTASGTAAVVPGATPVANGYHIGPGVEKVFDLGGATYMAAITSSSTTTLYCTTGAGQ